MKIDRLMGILTLLQQTPRVTAPFLARRFEVSRRTINRDIEDLCRAGIPIVTTQGAGGGISLMEGFCLDTTLFTREELSSLFIGLGSLQSVSLSPEIQGLAEKLGGRASGQLDSPMLIDLASFYKEDLARKLALLKAAIQGCRKVEFRYYYSKGEEDKQVEPYLLLFKWSDWYLFGLCPQRQDFRLYKLRRLWELRLTQETFSPRPVPEEKKRFGSNITDDYWITALYDSSVKYRLVEEYGPHSFTVMEDGRLFTRWGFSNPEEAVWRFLSFGSLVEVIDPPEIVERMRQAVKKIAFLYEGT